MELPHDPEGDRLANFALADKLSSPEIADYFLGNSNRMAAARVMLDLLDVHPIPDWAVRSPTGRAAIRNAAVQRFKNDHPHERFDR